MDCPAGGLALIRNDPDWLHRWILKGGATMNPALKHSLSLAIMILITMIWTLAAQAQNQPIAPGQQGVSPSRGAEVEKQFHKARESFLKKDYQNAAVEIRQGAEFLKKEAEQAAGEGKQALLASAEELEQLADRERKGAVNSTRELEQAFARANHALAKYYQGKASESWARRAFSEAGRDLREATVFLENALGWADYQLEAESRDTIKAAKAIGEKMQQGAGWIESEAGKAIEAMRKEIDEAGQKMRFLKLSQSPSISVSERAGGPVDLSTAIIQAAKMNMPAVVYIEVTESRVVENPFWGFGNEPFFHRFFGVPKMPRKFKQELKGLGSGMILDSRGNILTNNHVAGGATKMRVTLADGTRYPARLVGADPKTDLAVIQISAQENLPYVTFGNSDKVEVGEWVVAIGAPRALEKSVTQGIISAKHRTGVTDPSGYQDFLQTDAPINPGNSGGPLLNLYGEVIGVNAAIASESGGFEGIGFTIPSNIAIYVSKALIAHGKVERGWLGISIRDLTPEIAQSLRLEATKGALVADVVKGGPAEKAGLKKNDVVIGYLGKDVPDSSTFRNEVAATPIGQEAKIVVLREGKKEELTVRVGSLEEGIKIMAAALKDRFGLEVRPVTAKEVEKYGLNSNQGVTITWVDPKGPFGQAGFEVDDMILQVENLPIAGLEGYVSVMSALKPNQKVSVMALDHRTGNVGTIMVAIGKVPPT
jgi:Do/DeqQ family serine protease